MRRRDAELNSDPQRPRQRHPPSASPSGRGRGGGGNRWRRGRGEAEEVERGERRDGWRGRVANGGRVGMLPKRPTSGSGDRRLDICGSSNGRRKLAHGHPDHFDLLRSLPSTIDALDTRYESNDVFSQLQGSAT